MNDELSFLSPAQLAHFDTLVAAVGTRVPRARPMSICMECCKAMAEPPPPRHCVRGTFRALPPDIRRAIDEHSQGRLPNFAATSPSFAAQLLGILKARELDPPSVYKAAGVDRRSYSDIVNDEHHPVAKLTAIRFALALHLTRGQADQLLHAAGYTFSRASITDAIFDGCFEAGIYDFAKIDAIRRHYHQRPLFHG